MDQIKEKDEENKKDKNNVTQEKPPKKENEKSREDYLIDSTRVFCYSFVNEYLMEHIENRINENTKQQNMVTKNYQDAVLKTLGLDEKSKRRKTEEKNRGQESEKDNLTPQEQKRILDQLDKNYKESIEILESEEVMLRQYKSDYLYSLNIYNEDESLNLTTNIPDNCFLMDILKAVAVKPLHIVTINNSKEVLKKLLDDHINLYFCVVINEKERKEFISDETKRNARNIRNAKENFTPKDNAAAVHYKNLLRQQNYLEEAFKKIIYYDADAEASEETELDDAEKEIVRKLYMTKIPEDKRRKYPLYSIKQIVILENQASILMHLSKDVIFRNTMSNAEFFRIESELIENAISIYGYDDIFATKNREEALCFDENLRTRDGYFNSILFLDNTDNRLFKPEDITEYAEVDVIEQNDDLSLNETKMSSTERDNSKVSESAIFKAIDDINKSEDDNNENDESYHEEETEQYIIIPVKNLIKSSSHMYYIGVTYREENGVQKSVIFGVKEKDILRYKGRNMFIVKDNYYKKYNLYLKDTKELNGSYVEIDDYISKAFLLEHFKTITSAKKLKNYIEARNSNS